MDNQSYQILCSFGKEESIKLGETEIDEAGDVRHIGQGTAKYLQQPRSSTSANFYDPNVADPYINQRIVWIVGDVGVMNTQGEQTRHLDVRSMDEYYIIQEKTYRTTLHTAHGFMKLMGPLSDLGATNWHQQWPTRPPPYPSGSPPHPEAPTSR